MANFSWAVDALALLDETLNVHAAEIKELQAARVPRVRIEVLYPVVPENYWRSVSELIMAPVTGKATLAYFKTDVLNVAFKHNLLGDERGAQQLYSQLHEGAERASIEYPGLGVAGGWSSILGLYGFPNVLHGLLSAPAERWVNWPPKNLAYSFEPIREAAEGLTKLLT